MNNRHCEDCSYLSPRGRSKSYCAKCDLVLDKDRKSKENIRAFRCVMDGLKTMGVANENRTN